jgi:uncharacterized protein
MSDHTERRALRRELTWYLVLTFGSTWALAAFAATRGGLGAFPVLPLAMLFPMTAAFVVQRFVAKRPMRPALGFRVGNLRYWIFAPLALVLLWALVFALSSLVHPSAYKDWPGIAAKVALLKNVPSTPFGVRGRLAVAFLITAIVAPLLNLPIFLGEEVGWRAFMTPRLVALYGRPGLLLGGAIWGVWHTPFIFMGLNYPQHPALGHLLWIPFCIAFGIILQTVYARGGSVVPAALCHGITNQIAALTIGLVIVDSRFNDLVDGPAGVVALVTLIVPAVYCYITFPLGAQITIPPVARVAADGNPHLETGHELNQGHNAASE